MEESLFNYWRKSTLLDPSTASNTISVSAAAAPDEVATAVAAIEVTAPVPNAIISTVWNLID